MCFLIFAILWFIIPFIRGFSKKRNAEKFNSRDIENITLGIGKADELEKLYKKLIIIVHPDKNPDKVDLATKFTELLNQNRRNYTGLKDLEEEISKFF